MSAEETYLREDLRFIGESPINIEELGDDLAIIQKLSNEPNDTGERLSAGELKERFDMAGLLIKSYINGKLIPAVIASNATEIKREEAEANREANEGSIESESGRVWAEKLREEAEARRESVTEGIVARTINAIENMEAAAHTKEPRTEADVQKSVVDDVVHLNFGIPAGESGVYVGRGTPPDWCKIQIDPDGVPSAVGDMIKTIYDPTDKEKPVAFADELANTNSEINRIDNTKQEKITTVGILKGDGNGIAPASFDTVPTDGSSNLISSGSVYTAFQTSHAQIQSEIQTAIQNAIFDAIGGSY